MDYPISQPTGLVSMKSRTLDIHRVFRAVKNSMVGLRNATFSEASFRQELIIALILAPIAIWLGDSGVERALMIGVLFLVLIVELLNSAIETAVDRIGTEFHDLSRRAKDISSAAVLISVIAVPTVWALVLLG